jgi:hypothetical protein
VEDDPPEGDREVPAPPSSIVCVDCGGPCGLLTAAPEDGRWFEGDVAAYRCRDCLDRWDIVLEFDD